MKSKVTIWFLLLVFQQSFSQATIDVPYDNKIIGQNLVFQNEIMANEYLFPKRIHRIYIDTISGCATLQLRKLSKNGKTLDLKGLIVLFDLNSKTVKWTKKIDYSLSSIEQYNSILIFNKGNKTSRLNLEDGSLMWSIKSTFYYVNPKKNIGIGYKYMGIAGHLHTLEGIDMETGQTIWEKELNREYGWNKIIKLNESDILVVSGGLHRINIENGTGWSYETITGKKDYTETVAKNVGGIALGVLTGTAVISTGSNVVKDIVSNVVIDSSKMYMASKERLVSLNKNDGTLNWSFSLPEESTSKSTLILRDNTLILINKGYAYRNNKRINFGEPFILKINKDSGQNFYLTNLDEKKNPVLDHKAIKDHLLLLYENQLTNFSLKSGKTETTKPFNTESFGDFKFFIGKYLYNKNDDTYLSYIPLADSLNNFVQTNKDVTLKIDRNFNVLDEFNADNFYTLHSTKKNHKFLNQDKQTVILDSTNHQIAELNISNNFNIVKNKLYHVEKNSLIEIDLSQILKTIGSP